jgi:hypothetical protein
MFEYPLRIFDRVPVIELTGEKFIIGFGCPKSFGYHGVNLCGKKVEVYSNEDLTDEIIEKMWTLLGVGNGLTALIGTDFLADYAVVMDYANNKIQFCEEAPDFEGTKTNLEMKEGYPVAEFVINGNPEKMIIDSAAKFSCLNSELTAECEQITTKQNFFMRYNCFKTHVTPIYNIPVTIDEDTEDYQFGISSQYSREICDEIETTGIIGYEFFNNYKVLIDMKNGVLGYSKTQAE